MAVRLPTATRNAMVAVVGTLLDADVGASTIKIYSGAQPALANDVPSGTLLATFTLADPAIAAPSNGVATMDTDPVLATTGVAVGTAGWFRGQDQSGDTVVDGAVSATGGGGELQLNTTAVSIGLALQITSGTFTMPAG